MPPHPYSTCIHHARPYPVLYTLPYSTKYSRDKTFADFAVFQQIANVFPRIFKNHIVLLKYFNRVNGSSRTPLPNPESSLSRVVNRAAIEAANEEVLKGHTIGARCEAMDCPILRQHLHRKH